MQVGSLYSCKWNVWAGKSHRGWDMLMLIRVDYVDDVVGRYVFYDLIDGVRRNIAASLAIHCKELTKEDSCTQ